MNNTLALLEILRIDGAYNMTSQFYGAIQHVKLLAEEHNIEIDKDIKEAEKVNAYIRALYQTHRLLKESPTTAFQVREIIQSWTWWKPGQL